MSGMAAKSRETRRTLPWGPAILDYSGIRLMQIAYGRPG